MTPKELITSLSEEIKKEEKVVSDKEAMLRLQELMELYDGDDRLISTDELLAEIENEGEEPCHSTGIKGLDGIIRGFYPGQVITLVAMTKSGKTSLMMDLTTKASVAALNPLWLPYEEKGKELIRKFLYRNEKPPMMYLPKEMTERDLVWAEKKIVEGIIKFGSKIVFTDHLGRLTPKGTDRNDLLIEYTMQGLKSIAERWGITIFVAAHTNNDADITRVPDLNNIKGSSSIKQESDTVLVLWREAKRENRRVVVTNNTVLSVQANRKWGDTGDVDMVFENGHFIERAWEHEDPLGEEHGSWN